MTSLWVWRQKDSFMCKCPFQAFLQPPSFRLPHKYASVYLAQPAWDFHPGALNENSLLHHIDPPAWKVVGRKHFQECGYLKKITWPSKESDTTIHDQGLWWVDKLWTEQPGYFVMTQFVLSTELGEVSKSRGNIGLMSHSDGRWNKAPKHRGNPMLTTVSSAHPRTRDKSFWSVRWLLPEHGPKLISNAANL